MQHVAHQPPHQIKDRIQHQTTAFRNHAHTLLRFNFKEPNKAPSRIHARGTARGDRDHWYLGWATATSSTSSSRSLTPDVVPEQLAPNWRRTAQLPQRSQTIAERLDR